MGNFLSKTITGAAEGAFVGAAGGAVIGTFAVPVVGTVAGAAFGAITGAVGGTMLGAIDAFFTKPKTCRTLLSAEQYPPISTVLANNGRIDLLDSIRSAIKSGNPKAAMNVEKQLEDLALDHIIEAFKRGLMYMFYLLETFKKSKPIK
jgi:hypothetical protein